MNLVREEFGKELSIFLRETTEIYNGKLLAKNHLFAGLHYLFPFPRITEWGPELFNILYYK
jgi:hypothetical protein